MISTAVQEDQEREVVHIGECRNKGEGWQEMVRLLVRLHEGEEEVASERAPVQQQDKNIDKTSLKSLYMQANMCVHLWVFNMAACRRKIYHFITSMHLSTKVAARKAFPGQVFLSFFVMMEFFRIIGFMFQLSQFLLNLTARAWGQGGFKKKLN